MSDDLDDLSPMPFGMHARKPMQDVPAAYLHWLWHDGLHQDKPVARYIRANLSALKTETPDLEWDEPRAPRIPAPAVHLDDGLWQVTTSSFVAGFVVRDGKVKDEECAPILRKNLARWRQHAIRVGGIPEPVNAEFLFTKF